MLVAVIAPAPALPAAGITAMLLALLFMYVALWGLQQGYNYSLGALLTKSAQFIRKAPGPFLDPIAGALDKANHAVQEAIGAGLQAIDGRIAQLWDWLEWFVKETYNAMVDFGRATHEAIEGLREADVPNAVKDRITPLVKDIRHLREDLRAQARHLARQLEAMAADLAGDLERTFGIARKGIDAIRLDSLPRLDERIGAGAQSLAALRDYVYGKLTNRVGALERALAAGAIGAIAIHALTRVFPYWKCTNVRRGMRALCRTPVGFLDELLAATVTALVLSDVCRMATLAKGSARAALPVLRKLVGVAGAGLRCADNPPPAPLALHLTQLPQPTDPLPL